MANKRFGLSLAVTSAFLLLASTAAQAASEGIVVILSGEKSSSLKVFDQAGTLLADSPIKNSDIDDAISGNWDGTGNAPAVLRVKNQKVTLQLRNRAGAALVTLDAGAALKDIHSIIAADFDRSGIDDLAVIRNTGAVTILTDRGVGGTQSIDLTVPQATSYHLAATATGVLGIAAYDENSRNVSVTNMQSASILATTLQVASKGAVLPVAIGAEQILIGVREDADLSLFDLSGARLTKLEMSSEETALVGDFTGAGAQFSQIMSADQDGRLTLINPTTYASQVTSFNVAQSLSGEVEVDPCAVTGILPILEQISMLISQGKYSQAEKLKNKIGKQFKKNKCGTISQGNNSAQNQLDRTSIVSRALTVKGGEALSCDQFLPANDGAKKGFVMKNGDSTGKIVVVLPGDAPHFSNVHVLNAKYKKLETLKFSGFANPDSTFKLRSHWRGKASLGKYPGKILLQGVSGSKKICWVANKGKSNRVD